MFHRMGLGTAHVMRKFLCSWVAMLAAGGVSAYADFISDRLTIVDNICGVRVSDFKTEAGELVNPTLTLNDPGCTVGELTIGPFTATLTSDRPTLFDVDAEENRTTQLSVIARSDTEVLLPGGFSDTLAVSGWSGMPGNANRFGTLTESQEIVPLGNRIVLAVLPTTDAITEPGGGVSDTLSISGFNVTLTSDTDPAPPDRGPFLVAGTITVTTLPISSVPEPSLPIWLSVVLAAALGLRRLESVTNKS